MNLIEHTIHAIENATNHKSDITEQVLNLKGMSSQKVRHLLNNITKFDECNYLEIGCWKGSTAISALYNRKPRNYWIIDNFSQYGGPKQEFVDNFQKIIGHAPNLIDADYISFNPANKGIKDVNVYFYDGDHGEQHQKLALSHYIHSLQPAFIYICDDWRWDYVAAATMNAIEQLNLKILYQNILPANFNGDKKLWWNGLGVFVLYNDYLIK